jgi:imidazolonepropionase-like amidohydrolase
VRLAAEQGARWIKLFLDDRSLEYGHRALPTPDDETLRAVIEEAHRMGRPVGAHETVRRVFQRALNVGVDNIEHIPVDELLTDEDVALFMKGDHFITPTITVGLSLGIAREGHPARRENPLVESLQVLHDRVQREVVPAVAEPAVVRANAVVTEIIKSIEGDMPVRKDPRAPILVDPEPMLTGIGEANIMKLHEAGAKFCCGNDGGVPFTWPGTLFIEMELLTTLGFSNLEVLRSATVNAAELLDVKGELGSLEAGKMADVVLLSADPLADIRAVREVEAVFRGGALLHYGPRFYLESQPA